MLSGATQASQLPRGTPILPPPLHLASRSSALQTVALPYIDSAVTVVVCRLLMRAELPLLPPARYRSKHDPLLPPTAR